MIQKQTTDQIELLKRMVIASSDLQTSLSAITFLNEADAEESYSKVELRRYKCYETAFIVSYGRTFTNSKGSRYKKLSLKMIGVELSSKQTELHNKIINARHKKYAHSDMELAHTRIDLHYINVKGVDMPIHHIQWDEGLDFIDFMENLEIFNLIHKIKLKLYLAIQKLAVLLKDELPIYIKPT